MAGQGDVSAVGEAQGLSSSLWCGALKGDGRSGRTRAGENYQVSALLHVMHLDLFV